MKTTLMKLLLFKKLHEALAPLSRVVPWQMHRENFITVLGQKRRVQIPVRAEVKKASEVPSQKEGANGSADNSVLIQKKESDGRGRDLKKPPALT